MYKITAKQLFYNEQKAKLPDCEAAWSLNYIVCEINMKSKTGRKLKSIFWAKIPIVAIILVITMSMETMLAYAEKSKEDIEDEKKDTEEDLEEVNATIEELSEEQEGVESEIEEISSALVMVMAELEVVEGQIEEKNAEIQQATADYNAAVERANEQYEAMKIRIRYLYENGNQDIVSIYMESGSIAEALTIADYVEALYDYDRKMLTEYQDTIAEVDALKTSLELEEAELEVLQADYQEQQVEMESVMLELQELSDSYAEEIAAAEALAGEYAAKIAEQNAEIARIEEEERRKAEEEARRAAEEAARAAAQSAVENSASTGTVTTTNQQTYDVSSVYSASGSDLGKSIAVYACQFVGNPYVPGGTSLTGGADCSGFVYAVYKDFGYKVPRTSYSLRDAGVGVSYEEAQPGDVICYSGHVALYIGNGMIVHASTQKTGIKISKAQYREILAVRRIV